MGTKAFTTEQVNPGAEGWLVETFDTTTGGGGVEFVINQPYTHVGLRPIDKGEIKRYDNEIQTVLGRARVESVDYRHYSRLVDSEEDLDAFFAGETVAIKERTGYVMAEVI